MMTHAMTTRKGFEVLKFLVRRYFQSHCYHQECNIIVHFTVACWVAKPLKRSKIKIDFVMMQTFLLFKCKLLYCHALLSCFSLEFCNRDFRFPPTLKNFVLVFFIFLESLKSLYPQPLDKKFKISISCSSFSVYYIYSFPSFHVKKARRKTLSFKNSQVKANVFTMLKYL